MKINPLLLTVLCLAFTSIGFAQVVTPRRDVRDKPQGFDSTSYYRLTTQWQGDGKSLGVVNDGSNNKLTLADTISYANQGWKIISLGNGYYRLTTAWQGDGKSLDIVNDGSNNKLTLTNTANASGQFWKITPVGVSGYYRLTSAWQGDGKSLDVVNDGKNNQ